MKNFLNKKNILKFGTADPTINGISSAKKHIPQWYKDTKPFNNNNITFDSFDHPVKKYEIVYAIHGLTNFWIYD